MILLLKKRSATCAPTPFPLPRGRCISAPLPNFYCGSWTTTPLYSMQISSTEFKTTMLPKLCINICKMLQRIPPILFEDFEVNHFMQFIVSLRKPDGNKLSYSSYNTHRAALYNVFRDYKMSMSESLQSELKNHFRGLKRTTTKTVAEGGARIKTGKDALDFGLYKFLCLEFLKSPRPDFIFAHCFMIFCWNLMCRAGNMTSVCWSHLEWRNDALGIYFAHMKNDQFGERPRDPRHVYANPLIPEICPVLSLGVYLMTIPIDPNVSQLFPGGNQYDRFRRIMIRLLDTPEGRSELTARGMTADDLGTHSMRKGSATYASSGSTACPSSTAIHLRAGWALGGVQDTYLRYESAGDMFVGRTVSGLPTTQATFAILPPHFKERNGLVDDMIRDCFPNLPSSANKVAEFVLASVVYHHPFLERTLPPNHRLFHCPLFRDRSVLNSLKDLVECRLNIPAIPFRRQAYLPIFPCSSKCI